MKELTQKCVNWIKKEFKSNGGEFAVIGISGGKDSTVVAALCVEALGKENVVGVMMPNGFQSDINDSVRVVNHLGIEVHVADIASAYNGIVTAIKNGSTFHNVYGIKTKPVLIKELSQQALINISPKNRTAILYAVAQTAEGRNPKGGRVVNTSNLDESLVGYFTLWGDCAGDLRPISNLHVSQVVEMGLDLGLPEDLVKKAPADGLTGKTDADALGFTYADVESMYEKYTDYRRNEFTEAEKKAFERFDSMRWKKEMICGVHSFDPYEENEAEEDEGDKTLMKEVEEMKKQIDELNEKYKELEKKNAPFIINLPPSEPQKDAPYVPSIPQMPTYPYYPGYPQYPWSSPIVWCNQDSSYTVRADANAGNNGTSITMSVPNETQKTFTSPKKRNIR